MENVSERISLLNKTLGITKAAFAERLHISKPFVSEMCSGAKKTSDRTISDICRVVDVSWSWLLYGEGEMFVQRTENEELAMLFPDLLQEVDGSFRKRFVSAILSYPVDKLAVLEEFISSLLPKEENNKAEDE